VTSYSQPQAMTRSNSELFDVGWANAPMRTLKNSASPTRDVGGDVEAMALYAGEVVGLVRKIEPAGVIVPELADASRAAS
jgi:hypothetical protein